MYSSSGHLAAVLLPPLRHRGLNAEVYAACPAHLVVQALQPACNSRTALLRQPALAGSHDAAVKPACNVALPLARSLPMADLHLSPHAAHGPGQIANGAEASCSTLLRCATYAQTASSMTATDPLPSAPGSAHGTDDTFRAASPVGLLTEGSAASSTAAAQGACVRVQVGRAWASGVVLNAQAGLVLTNAHAVQSLQHDRTGSHCQVCCWKRLNLTTNSST